MKKDLKYVMKNVGPCFRVACLGFSIITAGYLIPKNIAWMYATQESLNESPVFQFQIDEARQQRELAVERKRLVETVGTAFDFNGDAQWSYEEEAFAKAFYLSGSGERKKTYEQVLRNYPTSYLEQVELKIPDKQRKLNGERK